MTPDQWRRARELFEQAVDTPPADLEAWIAARTTDPAVGDEVRSLLKHHTQAGAFLAGSLTERMPVLIEDAPGLQPGECVGAYRIERELGRGGMGRVYLALDSRLDRKVALKALAPHLVRDDRQRERLRREARAAALLTHPGICTVFALEEAGDDVFIASEFVEGETLRDAIDRGLRPSPAELLDTARSLAAAVASAHARGITHRDLKPENVMRTSDGRLKILDFGLALVDDPTTPVPGPRVTTPGTLIGTPAYMAPEQVNGGAADPRTDVFALGVLLYEFATGTHPFLAATPLATVARVLEAEPTPLEQLRADVPPVVTTAVRRCLHKRPAERFSSAAELLASLDRGGALPAADEAVTWWRTHVAVALSMYFIAVGAGWLVKEWDHGYALGGFVLLAIAATVGGVFRGHLLFAERNRRRATLLAELKRAAPVLTGVDLTIATVLVLEGVWATRHRSVAGALIAGLGVGIALAHLVLEHSTTDAAFGDG